MKLTLKYNKLFLLLQIIVIYSNLVGKYDATIVGCVLYADGIGRSTISTIDMLKNDLNMNFIMTNEKVNFKDVSLQVKKIIQNPDQTPGNVCFFLDVLSYPTYNPWLKAPESIIKIAYTMLESTAIPPRWVNIINNYFDAIAVPDDWLVSIYENCGVKKPIFVLPCALYLEDFLRKPLKRKAKKPFSFGVSAACVPGKNQETLIQAFASEFGNNPDVQLIIHSRGGPTLDFIKQTIKTNHCTNIKYLIKSISHQDYVHFIYSLDCYCLLSEGEGFSITCREALAAGIPCIISNNTAHTKICDTGYVKSVKAERLKPAYYATFNTICGYKFGCTVADAQLALRDIYDNYSVHLDKAHKGREWVKQYTLENMRDQYLMLLKPRKIILGTKNSIEKDCLTTNSEALYKKYQTLKAEF